MEIIIENSNVMLNIEHQKLHIKITSRKSVDRLRKLLFEVLSLLFLYLGAYPKIELLIINTREQDLTSLIVKFNSRKEFMRPEMAICDINSSTINEAIIKKFRTINVYPINSLQYLVSEEYKYVVANHKITLLLHVMEGLADRSILKELELELQSIAKTEDRIGKFKASAYNIFKSHFFKYQREYECGIFSLLKVDEMKFLKEITDTRNWHSHFYKETKKSSRLKKGVDMIFYFYIIFFSIRIYLVDGLGIILDEKKIKEYCYMLHDWILTEGLKQNEPLKSKTYNNVIIKKALEGIILKP